MARPDVRGAHFLRPGNAPARNCGPRQTVESGRAGTIVVKLPEMIVQGTTTLLGFERADLAERDGDELNAIWRTLRRQLLMISDGSTASYQGRVAKLPSEAKAPRRAGSELAAFESRWNAAKSDRARRDILLCAHHGRPPEERGPQRGPEVCCVIGYLRGYLLKKPKLDLTDKRQWDTLPWKRAVAEEPGTLREVAARVGVSHTTVKRCKDLFA